MAVHRVHLDLGSKQSLTNHNDLLVGQLLTQSHLQRWLYIGSWHDAHVTRYKGIEFKLKQVPILYLFTICYVKMAYRGEQNAANVSSLYTFSSSVTGRYSRLLYSTQLGLTPRSLTAPFL